MPELVGATEVFCPTCRASHPARQLRLGDRIIGAVDCPQAPWQTTLSTDADLFLQFRRQARFDPHFRAPAARPYYFHYLSITDDCNCRCPVCFTAADPQCRGAGLSPAAARQIAGQAREHGARTVVFIGGEPTVHPRLFELVAIFRNAGLKVWIATNGLRLGEEPELAAALKRAGVGKVCLQLDSLDSGTHAAIRGHRQIATKIAAAQAISAAGLILGIVCTVTADNLAELPAFCRTVLAWPQPPQTIAIQAAAESGRLETGGEGPIDREQIVAAIIRGEALAGLGRADFWPIPIVRPLNIFVHPDCAANTVAVVTAAGAAPLARYVDTDRLLAAVGRLPAGIGIAAAACRLAPTFLRSLRRPAGALLLRHLAARLRGRAGVRFCLIGTGAFLRRDFHDLGRIARCASGVLTASGCEAMCHHYGQQPFAAGEHSSAKEAI